MQVSADRDHPDYSPAAELLQVFLNGAEVRACITADDVRGELLCYALDEKGCIYIEPGEDRAKTVTLTGKVEIRVDPRAAPAERALTAEQLVEKYRVTE
jgi:hypothetical protein